MKYEQELGLLHRIQWRRIILDEGHAIKNVNSQSPLRHFYSLLFEEFHIANGSAASKACLALQGKYTWALTGTPVHNRVGGELQYLKGFKYSLTLKRDLPVLAVHPMQLCE